MERRDRTTGGVETEPESESASAAGELASILLDGVVGAAGGFVGTATMTVVLLVAGALGAFDVSGFTALATLVGLEAFLSPDQLSAAGYVVFLGGGMTTWPLLFAALARYLPGGSFALRGVAFGTVLWTGFVLAFYGGQSGTALALYALLTLVAHWGYGAALGAVFSYFADRPEALV
jgi:hypothetical protein